MQNKMDNTMEKVREYTILFIIKNLGDILVEIKKSFPNIINL